MAAVEEGSVYNDPNFGVIWSFIEKFGELCGLSPELTIAGLQIMLEDTRTVHQDLIDLHIRLLRRSGKKNVPPDKWEKAIVKYCHSYSKVDAWEIERFGYKKSKLSVKLILLKHLLESQFDGNAKFKTDVNKLTADELRLLPIGKDAKGKMYWYHQDRDLNLRIYREDQDDETWEVIVKQRDELVALISNLENHASPKKEEVSTTPSDTGESKDGEMSLSNSLTIEPKTDVKISTECLQFPVTDTLKHEEGIFIKPEPMDYSHSMSRIKQEDISFKIEEETVCCQEDLKEVKHSLLLTVKTESLDEDIKVEKNDDNKSVVLKSFSNALCHISPNASSNADCTSVSENSAEAERKNKNLKENENMEVNNGAESVMTVRESVIKMAEKVPAMEESSSEHDKTVCDYPTNDVQTEAANLSVRKETSSSVIEPLPQNEDASVTPTKHSSVSSECNSETAISQKLPFENSDHLTERKRMPLKKREIPRDLDTSDTKSNVTCDNVQLLLPHCDTGSESAGIENSNERLKQNETESVVDKEIPVLVQQKLLSDVAAKNDVCEAKRSDKKEVSESEILDASANKEHTSGKHDDKSELVANATDPKFELDSKATDSKSEVDAKIMDHKADQDAVSEVNGEDNQIGECDGSKLDKSDDGKLDDQSDGGKLDDKSDDGKHDDKSDDGKLDSKSDDGKTSCKPVLEVNKAELDAKTESENVETVDKQNQLTTDAITDAIPDETKEPFLKGDTPDSSNSKDLCSSNSTNAVLDNIPTSVIEKEIVEGLKDESKSIPKCTENICDEKNIQEKIENNTERCLSKEVLVEKSDRNEEETPNTNQTTCSTEISSNSSIDKLPPASEEEVNESSEAKAEVAEDILSNKSETLAEPKRGSNDELQVPELDKSNLVPKDVNDAPRETASETQKTNQVPENEYLIEESEKNVCEKIEAPNSAVSSVRPNEKSANVTESVDEKVELPVKGEDINLQNKDNISNSLKSTQCESDSNVPTLSSSEDIEGESSKRKLPIIDNQDLAESVQIDEPITGDQTQISEKEKCSKSEKPAESTMKSVNDCVNVENSSETNVLPSVPQESPSPMQCTTETPAEKAPKKRKRGRGALTELGPIEILPVKRSPRLQAQRLKFEDEQRKIETELQRSALLAHVQQRLNEERKQKRVAKEKSEEGSETAAFPNGNVSKKRGRPKKIVEEKIKPAIVLSKKKRARKRRSKQNQRKKKTVVVSRKKKSYNPWDRSSGSSYCSSSEAGGEAGEEEEDFEDEEDEDEELVFNDKSDHEFSPESEPDDENYQPTTIKRARTVRKEKSHVESDESSIEGDDKPCQKCSKQDHPEWILLCDKCDSGYHTSCLRPPLMVIPDGDWFCPPCCHIMLLEKLHEQLKNFDQLWKKKDREEMRKKRLAYVGISLDNVLKPEKDHRKEKEEEEEEDESEESLCEEVKEYVLVRKRSRRARKEVSYRFKEFDELIKSAIHEEPPAVVENKEPPVLSKGKDIANVNYDQEIREQIEEEAAAAKKELSEDDDSDGHSKKKKKHRRLNDLNTSSEEQDDDDDEDFQESSSNTEPSEEDSYAAVEDSDDSWDDSKTGRVRPKPNRYVQGFVDDDSDDSFDDGRRKGRRAAAKSVNYREVSESDEEYGKSRKKSRNYARPFREPRESDYDSDWKKPSKKSRMDFPAKASKRSGKMWRLESDDEEDDSDDEDGDDNDDIIQPSKKSKRDSDKIQQKSQKMRMNVRDFVKKSDDESSQEESNESNEEDDKDGSESEVSDVKDAESEKVPNAEADGSLQEKQTMASSAPTQLLARSPSKLLNDDQEVTDDRKYDHLESSQNVNDNCEASCNSQKDIRKECESASVESTDTTSLPALNSVDTYSKLDGKKAASDKPTTDVSDLSKNLTEAVAAGINIPTASKPKSDSFPERNKQNSTEFLERPTPLHPSIVEPFPVRSSPSKLTLLDNYSSRSSPQNKLTPLELYPPSPSTGVIPAYDRDRPPRPHGPPISHSRPPPHHPHQYHGEYDNYPGQYYPPYPPHSSQYSSSPPISGYQSPSGTYPAYQLPSPNYGYVPQAYEQGLYQGQTPHYGPPYPNYSPPHPPPLPPPPPPPLPQPHATTPSASTQGQSNGRFSIDNLLQRRMEGSEDDEFSSVNELVSYITGSHDNPL